jgi:hypothetical protein
VSTIPPKLAVKADVGNRQGWVTSRHRFDFDGGDSRTL